MSDPIRFLADENFRLPIVQGLRRLEPSIDILAITEAGMSGTLDPQVLIFAAQEGRVLLSHDVTTMPLHFTNILNQGLHSAGVILIPHQTGYQEAMDAILLVWVASTPEEWIDALNFMPWRKK